MSEIEQLKKKIEELEKKIKTSIPQFEETNDDYPSPYLKCTVCGINVKRELEELGCFQCKLTREQKRCREDLHKIYENACCEIYDRNKRTNP
jgi:hypothetical protein